MMVETGRVLRDEIVVNIGRLAGVPQIDQIIIGEVDAIVLFKNSWK